MLREDQTCPKCGALVTPQLARCRQCNTYLHGSSIEGFLVENLLPKQLAGAPGTGVIAVYIILNYMLTLLLDGPGAAFGLRSLAALQLGSTVSTEVQDLEPWRFVTCLFIHGDLLHVLFNLYALSTIGPIAEELHDRKRVVVVFVLTGVVGSLGSYFYHLNLLGEPFFSGSIGASGGVSGLIGLVWWSSRQPGSQASMLRPFITRWIILILLTGLIPGIDGAGHFGGLAAGILFAYLVPEGPPERQLGHRLWTAAALAAMVAVIGSSGLALSVARDQPYRLRDDVQPRRLLFLELEPGAPASESGQKRALEACVDKATKSDRLDDALSACELAVRAVPYRRLGHQMMSALLMKNGDDARARRQSEIAARLPY